MPTSTSPRARLHGQGQLATLTLRGLPVDFDQSETTGTVISPAIVASLEGVRSGCPTGNQVPFLPNRSPSGQQSILLIDGGKIDSGRFYEE